MPPIVIAGAVAAAGAIGGAVIGAGSAKSAANSANASQQQATTAQLTMGRENLALQKDIYGQNKALLLPAVQRGNYAGDTINALLGIPGAPAAPQAPVAATAGGLGAPGGMVGGSNLRPLTGFARMRANSLGQQGEPQGLPTPVPGGAVPAQPMATQPMNPQINPQSALENFANSAGMQFQLAQGGNMIEHSAAGRGELQSGATLKALQGYGQNTALNNYFLPYMGLLGGQQATGAQAGSAIAGVGSNFGNTAAGVYGGMGSNIQSGANAASNAALLRGQASSQMWNGIGGAIGGLASSFVPLR